MWLSSVIAAIAKNSMTLPAFLWEEIFTYLSREQLICLQPTSQMWSQVMIPLIGQVLQLDERFQRSETLTWLLSKYGRHTRSLIMTGVGGDIGVRIGEGCPYITSLDVELAPKGVEKASNNILELGKALRHLKGFKLRGCSVDFPLVKFQDIFGKVGFLELEYRHHCPASSEHLLHVSSAQVKEFVLRNSFLDLKGFLSIIRRCQVLEIFKYEKTEGVYDYVNDFCYDITQATLKEVKVEALVPTLTAMIRFEANLVPRIPRSKQDADMEKHINMFEITKRVRLYSLILCPSKTHITSLNIKVCNTTMEGITNILTYFTKVPHIVIQVDQYVPLEFPWITFLAKSFSMAYPATFPKSFYRWLMECFPLLEELHFPEEMILNHIPMNSNCCFVNLQKISSHHPQTVFFWEAMVTKSPNLHKILLKSSQTRTSLMRKFPSIIIGDYSYKE
ncbi:hypothetical protein DSO57_1012651 [Entomophthora muscae]|uniref:Uncharacterized protein n=1 Tax=Entomophthora muscae TaxID=34485 RepID=A0ACC2RWZ2_9FUNG|nr:hypothetical protein DSO57_1012651 [Entomophthora muscae]